MSAIWLAIILGLGLIISLGAALYALAPHVPATPKDAQTAGELDRYLDRLVASGNPPGLSAVVVRDGRIVYNRAFGYADSPRKIRATPDTVYHWWSMTKIPTAIAIMQLRERGKLGLEDAVRTYLPWFDVNYPSSQRPAISIRHLLQHTSGLPDTIPAMVGWVHYDDATRDQTQLVQKYLPRFRTLKFEPGPRASYSNLNYMLLGTVIEAVSGQSYDAYIAENVLRPIGMSNTGFVYTPAMAEHEAAGSLPVVHAYTALLPALLNPRRLIRERQARLFWLNRVYIDATPSTGLIGSATDVARLMMAYLNGGMLDGNTILHRESVSLLTDTKPIDGHGLAWFVSASEGKRFLEHAGGGPGFATVMRLYPDTGLGIAILANGTDLDRDGLIGLLTGLAQ